MGKPKCFSIGVQGDASYDMFSAGLEIGLAISTTSSNACGYFGGSWGGGICFSINNGAVSSKAYAGGLEFGLWWVKPKDLAGPSAVIAMGVAGIGGVPAGVEVQIIFAIVKGGFKFTGLQITLPNIGSEVELSLSDSITTTF